MPENGKRLKIWERDESKPVEASFYPRI